MSQILTIAFEEQIFYKYFTNIFIQSKIELPPALAGEKMMALILKFAFEAQIL